MQGIFIATTAVLGAIIGSFLNVVILRMNTGKGINGRSMCFSCGKTLSWYELIPIVSFLMQHGKCRSCRSRISVQYPLVEIMTAALFAGMAAHADAMNHPVTFVLWLVAVSVGVVIAVYDILHRVIPVVPLVILFVVSIALGMHGIGFLVVPIPFLILWVISRGKWIGFGDIELMACIGMLLGTASGILAVVVAFWIACALVLPWYVIRKMRRQPVNREIPLGPFLLVGAYLAAIGIFDSVVPLLSVIK